MIAAISDKYWLYTVQNTHKKLQIIGYLQCKKDYSLQYASIEEVDDSWLFILESPQVVQFSVVLSSSDLRTRGLTPSAKV